MAKTSSWASPYDWFGWKHLGYLWLKWQSQLFNTLATLHACLGKMSQVCNKQLLEEVKHDITNY